MMKRPCKSRDSASLAMQTTVRDRRPYLIFILSLPSGSPLREHPPVDYAICRTLRLRNDHGKHTAGGWTCHECA
jgi:hypothetical protein